MNPLRACFLLCFLLFFSGLSGAEKDITGTWKGEVTVPGTEISVVFTIEKSGDGKLAGTLLVPSQFPHKIPLTFVMVKDRDVRFDAADVDGGFSGRLSGSGKRIKGTWEQAQIKLPLTLELAEDKKEVSAIARPQLSVNTGGYIAEEVIFKNRKTGYSLAGTLTRPENPFRPSPGVILVSDSGPHDRDATTVLHKLFLVLADYLTRKGFAVLRYDDRGIGKSEADFTTAVLNDFASDAEAAIEYLRSRKEIDNSALGIIGHGEGGLVAPMVANRRDDVQFIVLMGAPGLPGRDTILLQSDTIGKASGASQSLVKVTRDFLTTVFSQVLSPNPDGAALEAAGKKFEAEVKKLSAENPAPLAEMGPFIEKQISVIQSFWLPNYLAHDPGPVLKEVNCAVLAIGGEKDTEVPSELHLPRIEAHLKAGGNTRYQVRELKGMNHLFQECETGLPGEYGAIEQTISPRVLKGISEWLTSAVKQVKR